MVHEDATNRSTRRVALLDRHDTEKDAVSVTGGQRVEVLVDGEPAAVLSNEASVRFDEGDSHTAIMRLLKERGGSMREREIVYELGHINEKTVTNAIWDLVNEYGALRDLENGAVTVTTYGDELWEERAP